MKKNKRKVLLIGWDAADWKVINPLLDGGMMPALESLINNGVMGNMATLDPPLSPMLWTSISTGKHADQHGILGFIEPAPEGKGVRPYMITSRKVKAIWNMLTQAGFKTNVVGWWPSHPAEPINGISISNFYQRATVEYGKEWPLAPGAVHPKSKEKIFKELRVHPRELTEAHILPFIPDAAKIDQEKDKRLSSLAKIIADCSTIHSAGTWILENEEWDFTAIYYDAIDHFCHGFMRFHPPQMKGIPDDMFQLYKGVVQGGYIYHDMMLSRLLQLVDEDTTVILLSDHGFHSDHLRPKGIPKEPAGPAWEHRNYGIFCMKGPGIKKDERVYGTTLLDIVPTLLTLFGLPVGRDMPGKPVVQAFEEVPQIEYIDSWEKLDGECGMHPKDMQRDPIGEQAAMQQLIELGYIQKPDENVAKNIEDTVDESKFYLARVYMNKNNYSEALPILEDLYTRKSDQVRYAFRYAKCLEVLSRIDDSNDIVQKIIDNEKKEYPALFLLKGTLEYAKGNYEKALELLRKTESLDSKLPQLHQQIGFVYLKMRRPLDAEKAFMRAYENDPENEQVHYGLAQVKLRRKEYELAAEYALNAVGLLYYFPRAHLTLGIALAKLRMYERAVEAFEVSLKMTPGLIAAHKYLSYIYLTQIKDKERADMHIEQIKNLREDIKVKA
jgi:predicted AlkP superfamily phosphohydrolase/phosphomutase/tetratricopeptide (TPR) repeat protein